MEIFELVLIGVLGLAVGSFLNVCIYRIPKNKSISYPPSHCFSCKRRLKVIDLIPVLSYLFLKGKCRYCNKKISLQYPIVEIITGVIYILIYCNYGFTINTIAYCFLASILIVVSMIDYTHYIIPDRLNLVGLIVGLVFVIFTKGINHSLLNNLYGLLIGGGIFLLIAILTGAMGGGDIKLMAVLGVWFGYKNILLITILSFIIGSIVSIILLVLKKKSRKDYIPFGPFISAAAIISILYGSKILHIYFDTVL